MGLSSGKEMEVLHGAEAPRALMRAEAADWKRDEETRLQLDHVWVTACEKAVNRKISFLFI